MKPAQYSLDQLNRALREIDIRPASTTIVHSSLMHLGTLQDCSLREVPAMLANALVERLGPQGTLAVPAGNWDYGRKGEAFDTRHSSVDKQLGSFSAYIASLSDARRSPNPIFSVAAIGKQADSICNSVTGGDFGVGSAWDRMFALDSDMLFLGAGVDSLTFARFMEHRFGVPYLYRKLFHTPVLRDKRTLNVTVTALLRFMDMPVTYGLGKLEDRLRSAGVLRETPLGGGHLKAVRMSQCYAVGIACLEEDTHFFLEKVPDYRPGKIPLI